jgi:hypothetical protein
MDGDRKRESGEDLKAGLSSRFQATADTAGDERI